jgi:DNA-binding NarL/FixJ family response regulator
MNGNRARERGAPRIRVAVADGRSLIADALGAVVAADQRFALGCVASGDLAAPEIAAAAPDIVLLGVARDISGSLAFVDALARQAPGVPIVLIADAVSADLVGCVLDRSLGGLLLTDHPAADLLASLAHIVQGRAVLPVGWQAALGSGRAGPLDALSDRQLEVLRLLAEGFSYEEIGAQLFISVNTVKFHTRSIFERLGVRNRMAAARILAQAAG